MSETKIKLNLWWLQKKPENTGDIQLPHEIQNSWDIWGLTRRFVLETSKHPPERYEVYHIEAQLVDTLWVETRTQDTDLLASSHKGVDDNKDNPRTVQEEVNPEGKEVDIAQKRENTSQSSKLSFAAITGTSKEEVSEQNSETQWTKWESKSWVLPTSQISWWVEEEAELWWSAELKKEVEKIEFSNYHSHFKDESENLLKKIRNFRYTPKTRVGFVISLVMLTSIWIGTMMLLFPEKHSLELYKASILEMYASERKTQYEPWDTDLFALQEGDEWSQTDASNKSNKNTNLLEEELILQNQEEESKNDEIDEKDEKLWGWNRDYSEIENEVSRIRNHLLNRYK